MVGFAFTAGIASLACLADFLHPLDLNLFYMTYGVVTVLLTTILYLALPSFWRIPNATGGNRKLLSFAAAGVLGVPLAVCYMVSNRYLDSHPAVRQEKSVLSHYRVYHTQKHGPGFYTYHARVENPHLSLLDKTSTINIRLCDYQMMQDRLTKIMLEIKPGFLGLPWYESYFLSGPISPAQRSLAEWRVPPDEIADPKAVAMEPVAKEYWPNGHLKQTEPMLNGKRHGLAHYWFDDGKPYGNITYFQGSENGRFQLYRADGTLEENLSYRHGRLHGLSCWYDAAGKKTEADLHEDGNLMARWVALNCPIQSP